MGEGCVRHVTRGVKGADTMYGEDVCRWCVGENM